MTTGVTNLADLAASFLAAVEAAYDAQTAVAKPDFRYLYHGNAAPAPLDHCDALVVGWDDVHIGAIGAQAVPEPVRVSNQRAAVIHVWVFRCLTATMKGEGQELLNDPTPEQFMADATTVMTDAVILHRGLVAAWRAGQARGQTNMMQLGQVLPLEPQGILGGCHCTITAELS